MKRTKLAALIRGFRRQFVANSGLITWQAIALMCLVLARVEEKPMLKTVIQAYSACNGSYPAVKEKFGIASNTYYRHLRYLDPDNLMKLVGVKGNHR